MSKTRLYLLGNQVCFVAVTILLILVTWSLDMTLGQGFATVACILLLVIFAVFHGMLLAIVAEEERP